MKKVFPLRKYDDWGEVQWFKVVLYRSSRKLDYKATKRKNEFSSETNLILWNDQNPLDSNGLIFVFSVSFNQPIF